MHRTRYLTGLITLVLTVVGLVFLWNAISGKDAEPGLVLRVEFRDVRGLRSGADVRYRGVTVGTVRSVQISEDGGKALAELVLDRAGAAQSTVDSVYWIVSPRFSGLTTGATGLDTLVRDAYVAFLTPAVHGPLLDSGSLVVGQERPPSQLEPEALEQIAHGDLLMTLLVPENHGLRPGSTVVFRGTTMGDVRSIELATDGSHVEVLLRIHRRYRQTVTDRSVFWIARPHVSGALFSGITIADVSSLLTPFVAYHTPPDAGVMVQDGFRTAAAAARPDLRIEEVPAAAVQKARPRPVAAEDPLVLVHIVYAAVSKRWIKSNDRVHRTGTGILYVDRGSRPIVLTARSLVDAGYTERGLFGSSTDIMQEQVKVMLADGTVLRAGRVWVDGSGRDLAALLLEGAPPDLRGTPAALLDFQGVVRADAPGSLRAAGEDGRPMPAQELAPGTALPTADQARGALIVREKAVTGILGQQGGREPAATVHALAPVPENLRPGS